MVEASSEVVSSSPLTLLFDAGVDFSDLMPGGQRTGLCELRLSSPTFPKPVLFVTVTAKYSRV